MKLSKLRDRSGNILTYLQKMSFCIILLMFILRENRNLRNIFPGGLVDEFPQEQESCREKESE